MASSGHVPVSAVIDQPPPMGIPINAVAIAIPVDALSDDTDTPVMNEPFYDRVPTASPHKRRVSWGHAARSRKRAEARAQKHVEKSQTAESKNQANGGAGVLLPSTVATDLFRAFSDDIATPVHAYMAAKLLQYVENGILTGRPAAIARLCQKGLRVRKRQQKGRDLARQLAAGQAMVLSKQQENVLRELIDLGVLEPDIHAAVHMRLEELSIQKQQLLDDQQERKRHRADKLEQNRVRKQARLQKQEQERVRKQKPIFDKVMQHVSGHSNSSTTTATMITARAGRGKTWLMNLIVAACRAQGHVVLCVASTAVAAHNYPGGRTAHSQFKIPCTDGSRKPNEKVVCTLDLNDPQADFLANVDLIVWDEERADTRLT